MSDSKVLAFVFGAVPMTLLHYYYWGWMTDDLMNGTSIGVHTFLFIPIFLTVIYCIYEKFVLYTYICADAKFLDTIPLTVIWVLECVIGTLCSGQTISDHWSDPEFGPGLTTVWCAAVGFEMMIAYMYCHLFLYVENKEMKKVLLVMLGIFLLRVFICYLLDYDYY